MTQRNKSQAALARWKDFTPEQRRNIAAKKARAMLAYYESLTDEQRERQKKRRRVGQLRRWGKVPLKVRKEIMQQVREGKNV